MEDSAGLGGDEARPLTFIKLFRAERFDGIYTGSAARGKPRSQRRNGNEHQSRSHEDGRVLRRDAVDAVSNEFSNTERAHHAPGRTNERERARLTKKDSRDVRRIGAQRDAD